MKKSIVGLVVEYLFARMPKPRNSTWLRGLHHVQRHVGKCCEDPLEATISFISEKFAIQVLVATYIF
jgi:hypothetical protein